ncbi:hypothetical protein JCM10207_004726 [Rhodosporidiobolus poonsookiae]
MLLHLGLLTALSTLSSAALTLSNGKLSVIDSVGASALATTAFTSTAPAPLTRPGSSSSDEPYPLADTDALKLSFTVEQDGKGVQPQQAAVVWEPVDEQEKGQDGRDHVAWVKVNRKSGKGKWELDLTRAPASLLSLSRGPLSATLLLGTPSSSLSLPLGTFLLPSSLALPFPFPPVEDLPAHWEAERFGVMEGMEWTFREGEKRVGVVKAALGVGMVQMAWMPLLGFVFALVPSLSLSAPSLQTTAFLALLLALEASYAIYWLGYTGNLIRSLPLFGGIALAAAGVGRGALGEVRRRRLAGEGKGRKSE